MPAAASVTRRLVLHSGLALAGLCAGLPARAAEGRVIFGFAVTAGTGPVVGAVLKQLQGRYEPDLGLKMTTLAGNAGALAMEAVHTGPADGGSVLLAPSSVMTLLPHLRKLDSVDAVNDFAPVAAIAEFTAAFAVGPAVPTEVATMPDYLRWVKDNPMQASYGVPGLGTGLHFVGMGVARANRLPLKAVAYKSMLSMIEDVQGGAVPAAVVPVYGQRDPALDGKLRLLAVASDSRWPGSPELPTLAELGASDVTMVESLGFFLPARTPEAKVKALGDAVRAATRTDAVLAAVLNARLRPVLASTEPYAAALARERAYWGEVVKKQHVSLQA